jgi:hypothetical protein
MNPENFVVSIIASIVSGFFIGLYVFFIAVVLPAFGIAYLGGYTEVAENMVSPEGIGMNLFYICIIGSILFSLYLNFSSFINKK